MGKDANRKENQPSRGDLSVRTAGPRGIFLGRLTHQVLVVDALPPLQSFSPGSATRPECWGDGRLSRDLSAVVAQRVHVPFLTVGMWEGISLRFRAVLKRTRGAGFRNKRGGDGKLGTRLSSSPGNCWARLCLSRGVV